jgi:predicted metal-dependent phosphoesterase TrpH
VHVLGLAIDPCDETLLAGLHANRAGRAKRAVRIADALAKLGIPDALDGARSFVTNPDLVSRAHFARYLVQSGHARTMQAVFDRYLGEGKPGNVPHVWASLGEAVGWIRAAGGHAVLAHPGRYPLDERERGKLLDDFKACGGAGIEIVSSSHTLDQYAYWAKRAAHFGFAASAGSDFHGARESYRDLGDLPPLPSGCTPIWDRF